MNKKSKKNEQSLKLDKTKTNKDQRATQRALIKEKIAAKSMVQMKIDTMIKSSDKILTTVSSWASGSGIPGALEIAADPKAPLNIPATPINDGIPRGNNKHFSSPKTPNPFTLSPVNRRKQF